MKTESGINERFEPWTSGDNALFTDSSVTDEEREKVIKWIKICLRPRKTPLKSCTSYYLKHILERDLDIYLTNNQFKHAMLMCGYAPVDEKEFNWCYRLSKKSLAFNTKARGARRLI